MIAYDCGQIEDILPHPRAATRSCPRENGRLPASREGSAVQKTKNSGNEAKKWLKTKDITILDAAHFAHFECKLAQIELKKEQETHHFTKTNRRMWAGRRSSDSDKESTRIPTEKFVEEVSPDKSGGSE